MMINDQGSDPESVVQADKRVLLVDDNEAVRRGLARYLEIHGYQVTQARDGDSALAELEAGEPYPILLTDLRLPDREGIEIAHRAREICCTTWIGLITGWDVDPDDPIYEGIESIMFKPIDAVGLLAKLKNLDQKMSSVSGDPSR